MKKIVYKYRINKFSRFTNGLLFAIISLIALSLCLSGMAEQTTTQSDIILPFGIAIISMSLGFLTMFREGTPKQKI